MSLCVFRSITVDDVVATIRESPSKQYSLDPLPTWLLKDCVTILGPYITNIINISLSTGVFPKPWKHDLISPLLKKAGLDEAAPANFRTVSNLPILSKWLERVVHRQLAGYLDSNKLLTEFQSAYRHGHSTETAVLKVFWDIVDAIGHGQTSSYFVIGSLSCFRYSEPQYLRTAAVEVTWSWLAISHCPGLYATEYRRGLFRTITIYFIHG